MYYHESLPIIFFTSVFVEIAEDVEHISEFYFSLGQYRLLDFQLFSYVIVI